MKAKISYLVQYYDLNQERYITKCFKDSLSARKFSEIVYSSSDLHLISGHFIATSKLDIADLLHCDEISNTLERSRFV